MTQHCLFVLLVVSFLTLLDVTQSGTLLVVGYSCSNNKCNGKNDGNCVIEQVDSDTGKTLNTVQYNQFPMDSVNNIAQPILTTNNNVVVLLQRSGVAPTLPPVLGVFDTSSLSLVRTVDLPFFPPGAAGSLYYDSINDVVGIPVYPSLLLVDVTTGQYKKGANATGTTGVFDSSSRTEISVGGDGNGGTYLFSWDVDTGYSAKTSVTTTLPPTLQYRSMRQVLDVERGQLKYAVWNMQYNPTAVYMGATNIEQLTETLVTPPTQPGKVYGPPPTPAATIDGDGTCYFFATVDSRMSLIKVSADGKKWEVLPYGPTYPMGVAYLQ